MQAARRSLWLGSGLAHLFKHRGGLVDGLFALERLLACERLEVCCLALDRRVGLVGVVDGPERQCPEDWLRVLAEQPLSETALLFA